MNTRFLSAALLVAAAAAGNKPLFTLHDGFDLEQIPRGLMLNDGKSDPKAILDELQKTFNDFKTENDKLLNQVKTNGAESATTRENVEKLNKRIDELQSKLDEEAKANKANEAALNRLSMGGGGSDPKNAAELHKQINAFSRVCNTNTPLDAESYEKFKKAQNAYWRNGDKSLGAEVLNMLSVAADGEGYFASPDVSGRMVMKIYESSPMRELASVQVTGKDSVEGLYDNDEGTCGWVGEDEPDTRDTETKTPDLGGWEIKVNEMYAMPSITQNMLDDADFDVETWLANKTGAKLGRTEATAFVTGNGVKKPRGILNYDTIANDNFTWGKIGFIVTGGAAGFASSSPADVLFDAVTHLKQAYRNGAAWLMARSTVGRIRKFKDGQGQYLWQPSLQVGQPASLLGYRLAEGEDMPALAADAFPIAFGNFAEAYQIVDRQGIRVLRDPLTKKGRVKFYTTKRTGGGVINFEALKLIKCST